MEFFWHKKFHFFETTLRTCYARLDTHVYTHMEINKVLIFIFVFLFIQIYFFDISLHFQLGCEIHAASLPSLELSFYASATHIVISLLLSLCLEWRNGEGLSIFLVARAHGLVRKI